MSNFKTKQKQTGAALVVGLIMLVVITVLAVSGMNTASTGLAMARNDQNVENAFQMAETGIEAALIQQPFDTTTPTVVTGSLNGEKDKYNVTVSFDCVTIVPDRAFSLGTGTGVSAIHFNTVSNAESLRKAGSETVRDASARHTQAFYVVGPSDVTLNNDPCGSPP